MPSTEQEEAPSEEEAALDPDPTSSLPGSGAKDHSETLLRLKGLTKDFKLYRAGRLVGRIEAVSGLDLEVPRGSIFGFLGPNGAGKTTTIKCACGMLNPEAGLVTVAGHDMTTDPSLAKARIGYLPEAVGLYPHLNALQTLAYYGSFYDIPKERLNRRATELLELFGLADRVTERWAATPWACASAWPWPRPCSTSPNCSSWTSPPRVSTPRVSGPCASSCGTSTARA